MVSVSCRLVLSTSVSGHVPLPPPSPEHTWAIDIVEPF